MTDYTQDFVGRLWRRMRAAWFALSGRARSGPSGQNEIVVACAYQAYLGRQPSSAELASWTSALLGGVELVAFIEAVKGSAEALAYTRLGVASARESQVEVVIGGLYLQLLGREAGPGELDPWIRSLSLGVSVAQIIDDIGASEEARQRRLRQSAAPAATADISEAITILYKALLGRTAGEAEITNWVNAIRSGLSLERCVLDIANSAEAKSRQGGEGPSSTLSNSEFILQAYSTIQNRIPTLADMVVLERRLREGDITRPALAYDLVNTSALPRPQAIAPSPSVDTSGIHVLGTRRVMSRLDWQARQGAQKGEIEVQRARTQARFALKRDRGVQVSAIASLFKGGEFIEHFLDNIVGQTLFNRSELIIIDAASPDGEGQVVKAFAEKHKNIRYVRARSRIGIYEAWNIAVGMAKGKYLTTTNVDDLRRADSFELQASALDALPFADIVYQDFLYSFEPNASFEKVEATGLVSQLPLVTPANLLAYNSPHNAPMWRKSLHDEIGLFNEKLQSAGDYDFWLRCLTAEKTFFKLNDLHVAYYVNPKGLSTASDAGASEALSVACAQGRKAIPGWLTKSFGQFEADCGVFGVIPAAPSRYDLAQNALKMVALRRTARSGAGA